MIIRFCLIALLMLFPLSRSAFAVADEQESKVVGFVALQDIGERASKIVGFVVLTSQQLGPRPGSRSTLGVGR